MKEEKKTAFLNNLKASGGIICVACEATGISRNTYYRWRESDHEFAEFVDEIMDAQVDYVENKLMELINAHDTTATIFYLKTKGKKRGWNEKAQPVVAVNTNVGSSLPELPPSDISETGKITVTKRIRNKKNYIVKLLKDQGKYTSELSMQVSITAQLLVRTEILAEEVLSEHHSAVDVELSREGHERKAISPKEKLYLDFVQQSQKALRALGMNTDAKERKTDNDTLNEFLKDFGDEIKE